MTSIRPATWKTPSRTGEWGLMSACLAVMISPTSSWPDSHTRTNAAVIQAAVSQRVLPVSQASNPLLIFVPLLERMISLVSLVSFPPVHPLIQNRAVCHAYHPFLHSLTSCLSLSFSLSRFWLCKLLPVRKAFGYVVWQPTVRRPWSVWRTAIRRTTAGHLGKPFVTSKTTTTTTGNAPMMRSC